MRRQRQSTHRGSSRPPRRRRRRRGALRCAVRGGATATCWCLEGPAALVDELARAGRHRGRGRGGRLARAARGGHASRGAGLCRPSAVEALTVEAPARIRDLVELGVEFDEGLGLEGGHCASPRRPRGRRRDGRPRRARPRRARPRASAHRGRRGRAAARALRPAATAASASSPTPARSRRARRCSRPAGPPRSGSGRRIRRGSVGDGIAAAYRAGAALADLEFVQFHPTALVDSRSCSPRRCAARARSCSTNDGHRFTDELAPRDVVARAIAARGTALLDLRDDRPRPLPDAHGHARAVGLRPRAERRFRSRPRPTTRSAASSPTSTAAPSSRASTPPASAPARASTARTGSRRTRCSSASSSGAAPRSPRSASRLPAQLPGTGDPQPRRRAGDAGASPGALAGLRARPRRRRARAPRASAASARPGSIAESALARAESRGAHFRADYPDRERRVRAATSSSARARRPCSRRWQ